MTRILILTLTALLLGCNPGFAQTTPGLAPLGMTSPLGVGSGSPVPPDPTPLGATELASPGVSPLTSGVSPVSPSTGINSTCGGIGGSIPQASFGVESSPSGTSSGTGSAMGGVGTGTSVPSTSFDGGGMAGTASGTCPVTAGSSLGDPASSASSPSGMGSAAVGRLGVPLGSTELGVGGLSPVPSTPTLNSAAPSPTLNTVPCPTGGMTPMTGSC